MTGSDYERIAHAIDYIAQHAPEQPSLDDVAGHLDMSPYHFQRLFSRWAGVSPKRYLQVLTVDRAKSLLRASQPLLEVSGHVGLSSASRLHDHFVTLEAMTPGEYGRGGAGLEIRFGTHATPFGGAFVAVTERGVCALRFGDDADEQAQLERLREEWPQAELRADAAATQAVVRRMLDLPTRPAGPLSLHVSGTNFQVAVWRALLRIRPGGLASYSQVAEAAGSPAGVRAVGQAVGANPVAFLIPCHRVIRRSGELGGYHWGLTRKQAILAWEAARYGR